MSFDSWFIREILPSELHVSRIRHKPPELLSVNDGAGDGMFESSLPDSA
jgi:hypothetical protein